MKLKKIFFIILLIIFPLGVSANSLECPKMAISGSEISCHLKMENIIGISANYDFGNNFTVLDNVFNGKWKVYYKDDKGFAIGNITDSSSIDSIIKIKVEDNLEYNKDYILTITNINTTDINGKLYEVEDIKTSIKIVSNDAYLRELSLSNMNFTEEFRKDKYIYYAETLEDKTIISASVEDGSSSISGDIGELNLNYGINLYVVKVTSAYNFVREYKIYITRNYTEDDKDSTLKSLSLSSGEIDFKSDKFLYELSVVNEIETIDIEAVASSSNSTVEINKPDKLIVGQNEIIITVTALDKTQSKYVLIVTREDEIKEIVKKDNTKNKIIIFVVTAILVIILVLILIKVIQNFINFIKKNKER